MLDSVIRVVIQLLQECKCEIKNTKMENLINDELDLS